MTTDHLTSLKASLETSEGRIPWLYRDTAGNTTVGIGHLVQGFIAAQALPFHPPITSHEWVMVTTAPAGMRAKSYQIDSAGRLSDADMDALLDADIAAVQTELRARFPNYASWPSAADAGCCDVAFNAGLARFPRLVAAALRGDWATCAVECHRLGVSEARNERTADLFRQAGVANG